MEIGGLDGGGGGGDGVLQEENGRAECEEEIGREGEEGGRGVGEEEGDGEEEEEEEDGGGLEGSEAVDGGVALDEWVGFGRQEELVSESDDEAEDDKVELKVSEAIVRERVEGFGKVGLLWRFQVVSCRADEMV